jgi:FkbM family methyltransferase
MSEFKRAFFYFFELFRNKMYRKLFFLILFKTTKITVNKMTIFAKDIKSFISEFDHIFYKEDYFFRSNKKTPVIIDCGTNIGMSLVYFKSIFPKARIIAFEPDLSLHKTINSTIQINNFSNVQLRSEAISNKNGETSFFTAGDDSGSLYNQKKGSKPVKVKLYRLKDLLENETNIDCLKIDIEGAETAVLKDCFEHLHKVEHIFIDYHTEINKIDQSLSEILLVLEKLDFKYRVSPAYELKGSASKFYKTTYFNYLISAFKD